MTYNYYSWVAICNMRTEHKFSQLIIIKLKYNTISHDMVDIIVENRFRSYNPASGISKPEKKNTNYDVVCINYRLLITVTIRRTLRRSVCTHSQSMQSRNK